MTGEAPWSTIGAWFTEDAVFVDPAWGRVQGRDEITRYLDHSMAGFQGWTFPEEWTMVDGDRLVTYWWNRLPGSRADGSPIRRRRSRCSTTRVTDSSTTSWTC